MSNTTVTTSGTGTNYHSGAHDFLTGFSRIHVAQSLVFYVILVEQLFLSFVLDVVWYCPSLNYQLEPRRIRGKIVTPYHTYT
jgi:hypothetical protein